ncbi:LytR/AlgR family response regulator transcription factor [Cellulomonas timonensis]|uniref:LytR/AlgR family response regulator transcription factor n=1 Tax=Cellulomonas timonensis TaxID=1689271 RepID=UPI000835E596|nr:LytTR family DNA-binding domain-containing protein [Cellulomonas timonensis]
MAPSHDRGSTVIKIGIVEDDAASAALLVDHLRRYEGEHGEAFDVSMFTDGSRVVAGYRPGFDILLLDVQMPELDGFSAAERIRQVDQDVVIMFITNMTQHAIRGYEVDALSYVLKPVSYFAFSQEIKRSIARLRRRSADYVLLTVDGGLVRVATSDIVYLESAKHRTIVHTVDGRYSVVAPLKTMEAELEGKDFFRCNSGYLVNLRHVLAVQQSSAVMVGGHNLLISRPRKKAFLAALTDYLGGRNA